ncbi:MAG: MBOAT family O-acyltransferase, partial [Erysipelotrichaceae bacterium]
YSPFILTNFYHLIKTIGINYEITIPKFILPIGISFYTLQLISYLIDVYRDKTILERNYFKLLLFASFFPTMIEGPICRYNDVKPQLFQNEKIDYANLKNGILRISYGAIKKIVVADRLNMFIKYVFDNHIELGGGVILLGAIAYTIQLYMEFSGTMDVVLGSSEIFNIKLKENFNHPFFSKSISEFWMRWHISLGTWFKDYVYYPISLSKGIKKLRKSLKSHLSNHTIMVLTSSLALFVVWTLNGLWHGPAWQYLLFGLFHFILIFSGNLFEPLILKMYKKLHINRENKTVFVMRIIKTSMFVVIGEMFFRANGDTAGLSMLAKIFTNFNFFFNHKVAKTIDLYDVGIVVVTLIIVAVISYLKENNKDVRQMISVQKIYVRWPIYYMIIFYIIIFGAYGRGYLPVDPIYANF